MTTESSILNINVNIILTSVKKHVHDIVLYKVIPCQLTNDTSSVLLPMAEHCTAALHSTWIHNTCGVVDALADRRVGVLKLKKDHFFSPQNTKRYSDWHMEISNLRILPTYWKTVVRSRERKLGKRMSHQASWVSDQHKLYLNIQFVPRSKHTPSRF
jgi:hypothetical protein